jgi:hypothetical protein
MRTVLILIMAPILVLLAASVHACVPEGTQTYSMTALGWMLLWQASPCTWCSSPSSGGSTRTRFTVSSTSSTGVSHRCSTALTSWPGTSSSASPSLFAAPVFHASGHVAVRHGMLIAGAMSVVGILGPAVKHIGLARDRHCRLRDRLADRVPAAQQGIWAKTDHRRRCFPAWVQPRVGDADHETLHRAS